MKTTYEVQSTLSSDCSWGNKTIAASGSYTITTADVRDGIGITGGIQETLSTAGVIKTGCLKLSINGVEVGEVSTVLDFLTLCHENATQGKDPWGVLFTQELLHEECVSDGTDLIHTSHLDMYVPDPNEVTTADTTEGVINDTTDARPVSAKRVAEEFSNRAGLVSVDSNDESTGYLDEKLVAGEGVALTVVPTTTAGVTTKTLTISAKSPTQDDGFAVADSLSISHPQTETRAIFEDKVLSAGKYKLEMGASVLVSGGSALSWYSMSLYETIGSRSSVRIYVCSQGVSDVSTVANYGQVTGVYYFTVPADATYTILARSASYASVNTRSLYTYITKLD